MQYWCPRFSSCSKRHTRGTKVNISCWKNMGTQRLLPSAFPLHHAQTFLAKVKTKLQISIAEFYALSQHQVYRCSWNIVILSPMFLIFGSYLKTLLVQMKLIRLNFCRNIPPIVNQEKTTILPTDNWPFLREGGGILYMDVFFPFFPSPTPSFLRPS